jgi:hypothetical protein
MQAAFRDSAFFIIEKPRIEIKDCGRDEESVKNVSE